MIDKILKQAGVDTVEELYNMYPDEASFIAAYPEFATKMKMGGTPEAFPQTAPMDKFFSYGVPVPPTYHRDGGATGLPNMYPQIQSEAEFFSPVYADIANPYNKEYGGMMEAFPQATPYYNPPTGNAYGFMAEGGEQPEMIGVQNRIGNFMNKIADTASNARNKETMKMVKGMAKLGGLPLYQDGTSVAPGKYKSVSDFVTQNPLDAYTASQFKYDPAFSDPFSRYIDSMYREYYELDPDHTVYKDDPIYKDLAKAYGYNAAGTDSREAGSKYDLNQLAINRTPRGRGNIKIKATIDGQTGRGRSDDYMWQSMFNTENLAEAQKLAAEQGLRIDEGTAGLLGKRKKYTYTWGNQPGANLEGPAGSQMSTNTQPASGPNIDDMGFLERMFYKKGNVTSPKYNITKGDAEPKRYDMPAMKSTFDPTGYNADYSGMRNQIFQNRKRRVGDKLDDLYYKENLVSSDSGLKDTWSKAEERKKQRLENRYNRIGSEYGFDEYTAPEEIEQKMYGGLIKAQDGQVVEKETSGFRQGVENFSNKHRGIEQFYKNQGFKSLATNMLNTAQQPDMVGLSTRSFEMMNPALGTQKGTQDPQGGNIFYDKTYAVYDSFAPQYMQAGGGLKSGDVVYWDDNMIDAFIQAGGQVEFLD
jgi:hypothetical protein